MTHSVARVTLRNPKYDLVLPVMKTFQDRVQLPKFITHSLSQSGLNLPLFSLIFSEVYLDTLEFGFIFIFLIEIQARFWFLNLWPGIFVENSPTLSLKIWPLPCSLFPHLLRCLLNLRSFFLYCLLCTFSSFCFFILLSEYFFLTYLPLY